MKLRALCGKNNGVVCTSSNAKNTFEWMSEIMDLKKEKNFFETRVTEYKTGGQLKFD